MATAAAVTLSDGRKLVYAEYGDPDGLPLFGLHGLPGSRIFMSVIDQQARGLGIRIIAPERPGSGQSERSPHGTLASYADDIRQLADALGWTRFAVLGVSGGGPFALSCAHALPDRIPVVGLLSSIGPLAEYPDALNDMVGANRLFFRLGRYSAGLIGVVLPLMLGLSLGQMEQHVKAGTSPVAEISPEAFAIVVKDQREAIARSGAGVAHDMRAVVSPWPFRLEDIRVPVLLWHGTADNLAPTRLAEQMAERLPNCEAVWYAGEGHAEPLMKHPEEILSALKACMS